MKLIALFVLVVSLISPLQALQAADPREELIRLEKEISRFEKEIPFFTKSKIVVFFSFDRSAIDNAFYGIYLNGELAKTGRIERTSLGRQRGAYIGDFPVRAGLNTISIRLSFDNSEVTRKFDVDIPQYRKAAAEFLFTGPKENVKVTPRAWVIE